MGVDGPPQPAATAAVIDGHDVVHAGIAAWCSAAEPPVRLTGAFQTTAEYLAAHPDPATGPDVIVVDLQVAAGKPDFGAVRTLCERGERLVVFSDLDADEIILTCLDIGAGSYLLKSEGRAHLMEAVQEAGGSAPYVGPRMARALRNDSLLGRIKLPEREKEVLIAWFQTESKDAVGERLFIAPTTVRTHLQRARAKYASIGRPAPTKSALLARAIEDGILSLADL